MTLLAQRVCGLIDVVEARSAEADKHAFVFQ